MVVFYRNAPNTTPLIIRGNLDQKNFVGIFPRKHNRSPLDFSSAPSFGEEALPDPITVSLCPQLCQVIFVDRSVVRHAPCGIRPFSRAFFSTA
jgi:hypothetical protein